MLKRNWQNKAKKKTPKENTTLKTPQNPTKKQNKKGKENGRVGEQHDYIIIIIVNTIIIIMLSLLL